MSEKKAQAPPHFVITGNWKMHKTINEAKAFVETLAPKIEKSQVKVCLAVPYTSLFSLSELVFQKKISLPIGAQNMHEKAEGAFTGEISSAMVKDAGAQFVLLGHSERRHIFHETDDQINLKVQRALQEKLDVVLCIGELLKEREEGREQEVWKRQLYGALQGVGSIEHVTLAYEPVWAIGTGRVAHPEDAQRAHKFCRLEIAKLFGHSAAEKLIIQYGGSVQADNAVGLAQQEDINGLLVGGASLKTESFFEIIKKCEIF